jgi:DNA mismatch repair protein MutS2
MHVFGNYHKPTLQLGEYVSTLSCYDEIKQLIMSCIDDYGNILDSATPEIAAIRRKITQEQEKVKNKISSLLTTYSKYLQENIC